jgi:signal transduction histidine kinase
MQNNTIFNQTKLKLISCYAASIGLIVLSSGFAIHCIMTQAFDQAFHQELETIIDITHNSLEAVLKTPGVIDPAALKILPGICLNDQPCPTLKSNSQLDRLANEQAYSLRLLDNQYQVLATFGKPDYRYRFEQNFSTTPRTKITETQGDYYVHRLLLRTNQGQRWGYLQVSHSFHLSYDHRNTLCWILFFGVPMLILLISITSWWLSWIAMGSIRQSYEKMQQFTADAAHELRTPLAVARTAVESSMQAYASLQDDKAVRQHKASPWAMQASANESTNLGAETANHLQIVHRQITHLSRLSQELLWLSRSTSDECKAEPESCCINDLVNDLGDELAALAMEKDIDLQIYVPTQPLYIFGCSDQLYRAIANLINNAIQYTPNSGIVTVTLSSQEQRAIVAVQDNGIGMTPQELSRIFDRFYRVQTARSSTDGSNQSKYASGTGLGLPIVQTVVQSHHGTIQVKSQVGLGSVFTVQLPLMR